MTLAPLLSAPFFVQLPVCAALCAIVIGPMVLWRKSRDRWHKRLGYTWVIAMAVTAISSFGISVGPIIGPFGPIHILSVSTIWGLWQGIAAARQRNIAKHQGYMRNLYFWALGVAGAVHLLTRTPDEHRLLCRRTDGRVHSGGSFDRISAVTLCIC